MPKGLFSFSYVVVSCKMLLVGPVSTETLPMDIAVIIISEQPKTLGEMISKVIEVTVPALMVNVSCKGINWTTVDHIMMDFLDGLVNGNNHFCSPSNIFHFLTICNKLV